MSKTLTSHTVIITKAQSKRIREYLVDRGFVISTPQYTLFSAKGPDLVVSSYESGKLLLQGKGTREFIEFYLEPQILEKATVGYELEHDPEQLKPHIGVDESGKGDFFGPLVITAAYLNEPAARILHESGVQDSKNVKSAAKIQELCKIIEKTDGCVVDTVCIGNPAYNKLYKKFANLNRLLAWGHARAIENVLAKINTELPSPEFVLSDQFAKSKSVVEKALFGKAKSIQLIQKTKAESDIAVATASICARGKFVSEMDRLSEKLGVKLPKGASKQVFMAAQEVLKQGEIGNLESVCKRHFKTYQEVVDSIE